MTYFSLFWWKFVYFFKLFEFYIIETSPTFFHKKTFNQISSINSYTLIKLFIDIHSLSTQSLFSFSIHFSNWPIHLSFHMTSPLLLQSLHLSTYHPYIFSDHFQHVFCWTIIKNIHSAIIDLNNLNKNNQYRLNFLNFILI